MRCIITRGLKPEYNGFMTAIRGWPTQPSLTELESLLANQKTLAKQMAGISVKNEEEALFTRKGKAIIKTKKAKAMESKQRKESTQPREV